MTVLRTRSLAFSLFALLALGCGDNDNNVDADGGPGGNGGQGGSGSGTGPAYLLMHTVDSPEGRQNYVFVVPDLKVGELDNSKGREVSGASRAFALNGSVYVADGETAKVQRYEVNDELELVEGDELSMQQFGVTYFDTGWTFVNEEKAYYMNSEQAGVIVWNPKTMQVTGEIDLSSLINDEYANFYADGGTLIGDKLYAMFWNDDWEGGTLDQAVNVAVIDTKTNTLEKVLRDERCSSAWAGSVLPDGDFYLPGNNGMSHYQFTHDTRLPENCLLRIDTDTSEFDVDFYKEMNDLTAPLLDGSTFDYSAAVGGAIVWAHEESDATTSEDFFPDSVWRPVLVDTETWEGTQLDSSLKGVGWVGETIIVDGIAHFTVSDEDGKGALVRLDGDDLTTQISFSAWLQVVKRIR